MKHLLFFIYAISVISGILSITYYTSQYLRNRSVLIKKYLLFLLSFSIMVFFGACAVYMATNIQQHWYFLAIFIGGIQIGIHTVSYTLPSFIHTSIGVPFRPVWKLIFKIILRVSPVPVIILIFASQWVLYSIGFSFLVFVISLVYTFVLFYKNRGAASKTMTTSYKVTIPIFGFLSFLSAIIEILFFGEVFSLQGFSLSLPIVYLFLNAIFMSFQIKDEVKSKDGRLDIGTFSKKNSLTGKETEVIALISEGKSNKEIAHDLCISPSTVKNHIYNIYIKTKVQNRTSLIYKIQNS